MADWDGRTVLETPRLTLRTFRREDLAPFAALNSDPEVVRFLGGEPLSREDSDEIATWHNELYADEGFGLLAVERRSDAAFLGMCGLHHQESYPDDLEVAWRLAHEHWGQGFATEAGAAWLDLAFTSLAAPRVISITDTPNERSLAVMRRLGLTFDHSATVVDDGIEFDAVVWSITAERWHARPETAAGRH